MNYLKALEYLYRAYMIQLKFYGSENEQTVKFKIKLDKFKKLPGCE